MTDPKVSNEQRLQPAQAQAGVTAAKQVRHFVTEPNTHEVFNTQDAAKYLKVSKQLLELMRVRGGGPPYAKLQRLVRYRRVALDDWLIAQERSHTSGI